MAKDAQKTYGLKDELLGRARPGEKRTAVRRAAIFMGYPVAGGRTYLRRLLPITESFQVFQAIRSSGVFSDTPISFERDEHGAFIVPADADNAYLAQFAQELCAHYPQRRFSISANEEILTRLWPLLHCHGAVIRNFTPKAQIKQMLERNLSDLKTFGGQPLFLALWAGHGQSVADLKAEIKRSATLGWILLTLTLVALAVFLRLLVNWLGQGSFDVNVITLLYGAAFTFILGAQTCAQLFRHYRLRTRSFPDFRTWLKRPTDWLPQGDVS